MVPFVPFPGGGSIVPLLVLLPGGGPIIPFVKLLVFVAFVVLVLVVVVVEVLEVVVFVLEELTAMLTWRANNMKIIAVIFIDTEKR